MCFLSAKSHAVLCCFASDAMNQNKFFSPFLECAPRYLECGMGIILKDSKERRKFDFEGNAVTQFGGKHREDTVSSGFKSRVGESQKHLTGGTWKLNRVVGVSDVRRSQAMRGFVNKQEALAIDSTPHWQPVERSYQRCNMISFFRVSMRTPAAALWTGCRRD